MVLRELFEHGGVTGVLPLLLQIQRFLFRDGVGDAFDAFRFDFVEAFLFLLFLLEQQRRQLLFHREPLLAFQFAGLEPFFERVDIELQEPVIVFLFRCDFSVQIFFLERDSFGQFLFIERFVSGSGGSLLSLPFLAGPFFGCMQLLFGLDRFRLGLAPFLLRPDDLFQLLAVQFLQLGYGALSNFLRVSDVSLDGCFFFGGQFSFTADVSSERTARVGYSAVELPLQALYNPLLFVAFFFEFADRIGMDVFQSGSFRI